MHSRSSFRVLNLGSIISKDVYFSDWGRLVGTVTTGSPYYKIYHGRIADASSQHSPFES